MKTDIKGAAILFTTLFCLAMAASAALKLSATPQTIFHTSDCKKNLDSLRVTYEGKRIEGERLQQFVLWLERDEQVRRRCDEFFKQ